ncbi:MAG: hypothetical protein WC862_05555 [Patescibacteria group bacterium]
MEHRIAKKGIPDRLDLLVMLLAKEQTPLEIEVTSDSSNRRHIVRILLDTISRYNGSTGLLIEGTPVDGEFKLPVAKVQALIEYKSPASELSVDPYCYFLDDQDDATILDDPWSDKV